MGTVAGQGRSLATTAIAVYANAFYVYSGQQLRKSAAVFRWAGSASFLFRSLDGGATWTQTPNGLRDLFPGGGDSDVAVDSMDGTVYYADLWLGSSTVSVSHDQGETWIASPLDGVVVEDRD